MYTQIVEFATPQFDEVLHLRDLVLRKPLDMEFYISDIEQEYDLLHFACYDACSRLLATLLLMPIDDNVIKMRQVATHPDFQGKGIGTFLVIESEHLCKSLGYTQLELNARETAVPFYLKQDYHKIGEKFEEVGIPHYKLVKTLV